MAVACSRFNGERHRLCCSHGALAELDELGVADGGPDRRLGAGCVRAAAGRDGDGRAPARYDAVVCLGAVIRGETSHYDFVAGECAAGLQRVQLDMALPVVFGVLTTENLEQALERAGGALGNKGSESAATAVEMVNVLRRIECMSGKRADANVAGASPLPGEERRPLPAARTRRCSASSSPRARSSRPRSSSSPRPTSRSRRASDVDYRATIDDPRVDDVHILRPQEIPTYVAEGLFDLGVTGRDWIEETGAQSRQPGRAALFEGHDRSRSGSCSPSVPTRRFRRSRSSHRGVACRPSTRGSRSGSWRSAESKPMSVSPTGRPRPRCPTSPTPSSRSPRRDAPFGRPACGSSTRS